MYHYLLEDGGRGHEPRNVDASRSWEWSSACSLQEDGDFGPFNCKELNPASNLNGQEIDSSLETSESCAVKAIHKL